jgi:hypothetical protein
MSSVQAEEFRLRDRLHLETTEADEFVAFWRAGAEAVGLFSCVECGATVRSVRQLPSCLSCGCRLWEEAGTSPFEARAPMSALLAQPETDASDADDLNSVAGAFQPFLVGVTVGPILWLTFAAVAFGLVRLAVS